MRSGAMILAVGLALAAVTPARPVRADETVVDAATRERSRAAFRRGVAQLRAQDWSGARESFEEAWSLVQHPSILLNLGIARLRTDDPVLAENDLVRFLSEDPGAAPEELATARDALAEARSKIATLRVVTEPPSAQVLVDGKAVPVTGGVAEVRVKGGQHRTVVQAEGFQTEQRASNVPAKSEIELRITLAATDAPRPLENKQPVANGTRTIVGWSLAGVGAATLVAGGLMGLKALSLKNAYADPHDPSYLRSDVRSEGVTFRTGADIALLTGIAFGTGAVILLFTNIGRADVADVLRRPLVRW